MQGLLIDKIAKQNIPHYKGIYEINKIPYPTPNTTSAYIVNTLMSNSDKMWGHWFALIVTENQVKLLDSVGIYSIKHTFLKQYLKYLGRPIVTNVIPLQPIYSPNCGIYCLTFLYHQLVMKNTNFYSFINLFHSDTQSNDDIVCNMFKKNFRMKCSDVVLNV